MKRAILQYFLNHSQAKAWKVVYVYHIPYLIISRNPSRLHGGILQLYLITDMR